MRSFQIIYIILFFVVFSFLAWLAYKNVSTIIKKQNRNRGKWILLLLNGLVLLGFIFLYIYPYQPRQATNYPVYFYFNALLFTLFIFNVPNSLSFLLHKIFEPSGKILPFTGLIISTGLTCGMIYGVLWGSQKIQVNRIELEYGNLPTSFNNYKILQFSDIHIGGMLKTNKLLDKTLAVIENEDPDLLLFTGDIVNNFGREADGFRPVLKRMTNRHLAFSVLGNHDYGDYTTWESDEKKQQNLEGIIATLNETGFLLLNNENRVIKKNNDSIFLAGVENWGHPPFPQYANLEKALDGIPSEAFSILMTHDPAHWTSKVKKRDDIELTLSGHTHGMQWGIKLGGIKFSIAHLANKYWGGLYRSNNSVLYVNTGLGNVGIPWRLDMPPEITVFTLKRSKVD
ncbi:MAG: metallophosphoesterase [Tangfeifania sp.]